MFSDFLFLFLSTSFGLFPFSFWLQLLTSKSALEYVFCFKIKKWIGLDWIFYLTVLKKVNLKYYNESKNFYIVDLVAQSVTNNNVTASCYLVLPFYS